MDKNGKIVLVLNQDYRAFARCNYRAAILLKFKDACEVLEEYPDLIRSPSISIRCPAVIRLKQYIPVQCAIKPFTKRGLYERDKGKCGYCLKSLSFHKATVDHIIPLSKGGKTTFTNTVLACYSCNQLKGDSAVEEAGLVLKITPFKPKPVPMEITLFNYCKRIRVPKEWKKWLKI